VSSVRQSNPITQPFTPSYQPRVAQRPTGHQTWLRPQTTRLQLNQNGPSIHERAAQLSPVLHPAECRVLMDAVAPILFGRGECYVPPPGEPEQIAQALSSRHGLLISERTGYVDAYRPTLLGAAVLWQCLLHDVQARPGGVDYVSESGRTYHGWPTYETWLVYSWLTNDAATYGLVLATLSEAPPGLVDEALKALVEEMEPLVDEVGLHHDLLTAAYGHVDWQALANAFAEHGR